MSLRINGNGPERWELIALDVFVHHETKKALCVSIDGNRQAAQWLPKSRIHIDGEPAVGRMLAIRVTGGMAEEKGLM